MSDRDEETPELAEEVHGSDKGSPAKPGAQIFPDPEVGEQNLERVDLSEESDASPPSPSPAPVEVQDYDPAEDREKVRGRIAQTLVWLLVGVVGVSVLAGIWLASKAEGGNIETLKMVLELVLTPLVGLVGAVTGFYFGAKAGKD